MKKVYHKVLDDKGRVLIPYDLRKVAKLQESDIVRLCVVNKLLILERVDIQPVDMVAKLKECLDRQEKPISNDAVECFILASLSKMDKIKLTEIMSQLSEMINNKK